MKLIDADTLVHIPIYDDQIEETIIEEMSIADFLDTFADEGCPSVQRNGTWITDANNNDNAYCSECGLLTTKDLLKRIAIVGENKPKFCPNCGAKMEDKEW